MDKNRTIETSLVLTTGFLFVYFITQNGFFLYLAFAFGIIGIFFRPLAKIIAVAWFKLADILNYVFSKIIFGTLFFVVLFPISLVYRFSTNDKLNLKGSKNSNWVERNIKYSSSDLENIW